jgi:hypothetical protein
MKKHSSYPDSEIFLYNPALKLHSDDLLSWLGANTHAHIFPMADGKQHISIVVCGHVDAGKSTTTGRLIFELGGIPEREMVKLREEADRLGKSILRICLLHGSPKGRTRTWCDHCLHHQRILHPNQALHRRRRSWTQRFHQGT